MNFHLFTINSYFYVFNLKPLQIYGMANFLFLRIKGIK